MTVLRIVAAHDSTCIADGERAPVLRYIPEAVVTCVYAAAAAAAAATSAAAAAATAAAAASDE